MSPSCASYTPRPSFQLAASAGSTGPVDCSAHALAVLINMSTCGAKQPSGRSIRLRSNEPVPNKKSPGLNLIQLRDVAAQFGVHLDVRIGTNSVAYGEYEERRKAGQPTIIQLGYAAIAKSPQDAGRGFGRNGKPDGHAFAEIVKTTYDSLADGRAPGVWRWNGMLYKRATIQTAASRLVINENGDHPRPGTVWAAFGPDVVPVPPTAWGPDVPAPLRAVNPDGRRVLAAVRKSGHTPGGLVNVADLEAALRRIGHDWGTVVDPSDVRVLLEWAR